jgi:adenine-specific DNA-methyltransferase
MYPRLFLAKQLLTDDGVIFISIDDNEQHHLKMLCNEVFGEENFVGSFIRRTINSGKQDSSSLSLYHENLLVFAKNKELISLHKREKNEIERKELYPLEDKHIKTRGRYYISQLDKGSIQYSDSLNYPITAPDNTEIWAGNGINDKSRCFRWSKEKLNWGIEHDFIVFKKQKNKWKVYAKSYEFRDNSNNKITPSNPYTSLDFIKKEYSNFNATPELQKVFNGDKIFTFPKPVSFIKDLLIFAANKNDIILDFFAGSATTGHAVMDLNKADNGSRKFILVQIPEVTDEKSEAFKAGYKNIAQISKERLRRAITQNEYKEGFKVFELSPSNYNTPPVYNGDDENEVLKNEHYILDNPLIENYTAENLIYEIILKQGLSLHSTITLQNEFYKVYDTEREQTMYITLANKIIDENIDNLNLTPDDILVCFDTALNDTQKVNLNRNVNLLVI